MYEFNQKSRFAFPLQSGPHAWVQGLLNIAYDAYMAGGAAEEARYMNAVATAQAVYGADAPCHRVDPVLYGTLSDIHKDCLGFRYRGDCTRDEALDLVAQIHLWIDMDIREERRAAEIASQRSFGDEPRPTAMVLAFQKAKSA